MATVDLTAPVNTSQIFAFLRMTITVADSPSGPRNASTLRSDWLSLCNSTPSSPVSAGRTRNIGWQEGNLVLRRPRNLASREGRESG
jgi:hypothetical protein